MENLISSRILAESVEYMEHAAKAECQSKEDLVFHPYLATGISSGLFTRLQASLSTRSFTAAELLSHFPKKNIIVIVAYEGQEESSTEEPEDEEKQKEEIKQRRETKQPRKQVVSRKRTRSIAYGKVY